MRKKIGFLKNKSQENYFFLYNTYFFIQKKSLNKREDFFFVLSKLYNFSFRFLIHALEV